jgi:hypothetical protein
MNALLGENYLQTPIVTQEQSNMYTLVWNVDGGQTCAPSCTVSDFRIDLLGSPHCAWNRSAGRTFCRSFLNFHDLPDKSDAIDAISTAFFTRIKLLKAKYEVNLLQQCHQRELAMQKHCYCRKYDVCQFYIVWYSPF